MSGFLFGFTTASAIGSDGLIACPITLAWEASPDASVTGYALYYGPADFAVSNRLDTGPTQRVTLTNLYADTNYFFFVVSYNAVGLESVPSDILNYRPPALSLIRISKESEEAAILEFRSAVGSPCRVEYLAWPYWTQWQTLVATNAAADGKVVVRDPFIEPPAGRFYRVVRP